MISAESKEKVRDAVDFLELVGARTELRKTGARRWSGRCPFHEERTPSFGIDPIEKLYHCFGCGAGGDVFKFVQETEGLSFPEALEALADRYGVTIEREDEDPRAAERRAARARLLSLLERTATFYVRMLWESAEAGDARSYLASRGVSEDTARLFRVGFAPSAWDKVLVGSRRAGFSEAELTAAGLVQANREGRVYDRFRGRLMFPLADPKGAVVGFGARALRSGQQPKYLNSPEGELFTKGRMVYAADLARVEAARAGRVVLAEGYTDVIALHQAGVGGAVGSMGTAVTDRQAGELAKLASVVVLCMDADSAGQEAMAKAAAVLRGLSLEVRVVPLPPGSDPADVASRDGAEALRSLVDAAAPFEHFAVARALERGDLSTPSGRDVVLQQVAEVIRPLPPSVLREELVRLAAGRLGLSEALASTAFAPGRTPRPAARPSSAAAPAAEPGGGDPGPDYDRFGSGGGVRSALNHRDDAERAFLTLCLALPGEGARRLAAAQESFGSSLTRRAAAFISANPAGLGAALPVDDPELTSLIAELTLRAGALEDPAPAELDRAALHLELARLDRDLAVAPGERKTALAQERQQVLSRLKQTMR